jgi:RimJ/RimL family protein N-acetyltransferase
MCGGRLDEITIFRSKDYAAIRALATDPAIYPHIADDYHPNPDKWRPVESDFVIHLLARNDQGLFGFGIFQPRTWACYEAHFGFLPRSYGEVSLKAFKEMLAWMWKHTTAARIVGEIDVENRRAIAFALRAGCERYGYNPKSYLKGGRLRDRVCLGISKPE